MRVAAVGQGAACCAIARGVCRSARFEGPAVVDDSFQCRAEAGCQKQEGTEGEKVSHDG